MSLRRRLSEIKNLVYRNPRPSLNGLDRKLEKYLSYDGGFFIEAGANDGYSQSNTYYLEKRRGWKGILVEGIPELYTKCKRLRSRSKVINCALVSDDFPQSEVLMRYAHLMSMVDGAMKSSEEQESHLKAGVKIQHLDTSYAVTVAARTLESVLDEHLDVPDIDFFSLDVEGYEFNVLKGLNLAKYRPKYILVEARYFEEINDFLLSQQYSLLNRLSHHDLLYRAN